MEIMTMMNNLAWYWIVLILFGYMSIGALFFIFAKDIFDDDDSGFDRMIDSLAWPFSLALIAVLVVFYGMCLFWGFIIDFISDKIHGDDE